MSIFVLVHGAWQTASTWDLVTPRLRAAGHHLAISLLSGLENDANPLTPVIGLQSHIDDVLGFLDRENLQDVRLVGHSYAGMIITGVAEQALPRLNRLIYVDAFVPSDGQSTLSLFPEATAERMRQQAKTAGDGWHLPGVEGRLDMWGLKPGAARDFVRERLSDFSLRCFEEAVMLPKSAAASLHRTYIACVADDYPARPIFRPSRTGPSARDGAITSCRRATAATRKCPTLLSRSCSWAKAKSGRPAAAVARRYREEI